MIEVVFSDSAKGAMKIAKHYNKKNMIGSAIGYIGKKPSKAELEDIFEGEPVGGDSKDVVCIGFNLDIGDITDEIDSEKRKNDFIRVFGSVNFEDKEIERFFSLQREDFNKMLDAAKKQTSNKSLGKQYSIFSLCFCIWNVR